MKEKQQASTRTPRLDNLPGLWRLRREDYLNLTGADVIKEVDDAVIAKARGDVTSFLGQLEILDRPGEPKLGIKPDRVCILPSDDPRIVNKLEREKDAIYAVGTLVVALGNYGTEDKRLDLVAKFAQTVGEEGDKPNYYQLNGWPVGHSKRTLERTATCLREMGFNNVPYHREFDVEGLAEGILPYSYHLAPDLREGGKYDIYDIADFPFRELQNGRQLRRQLSATVGHIVSNYRSSDYILSITGHQAKTGVKEPLKRMLFGRVNTESGLGEIVFGDFDHLSMVSARDHLWRGKPPKYGKYRP